MTVGIKKLSAITATLMLSLVGVGAISTPAQAGECKYLVEDQTANDKPKALISLISPVLTDSNSIRRYDFEGEFTLDCDWFGVGMQFNQVHVPYGMKVTLVFHATNSSGVPLVNTNVKLRANKGYSLSNAAVRVNGLKARLSQDSPADGGFVTAKTDQNGNVAFVVSPPDDCTAYGGMLPSPPSSPSAETKRDETKDPTMDCYSQLLPEITGEKTDASRFVEIHYYDAASYATTAPLGTTGNLIGGVVTTTYNNLAAGVKATLKISSSENWTDTKIDGMDVHVGDLVLIKNQESAIQNGLYDVTSVGAVGNKVDFIFTRDGSNDELIELDKSNQSTFVVSGSTNQGQTWKQTNTFVQGDEMGTVGITWASVGTVEVPESITLNPLSPFLDASNSVSQGSAIQTYQPVGSKMLVAIQAIGSTGDWARNQPVTVRINLADSGANAHISAGIVGNTGNGLSTTLSNSDATKTIADQLVLTGTTDAFGIVTFQLNNTDVSGEPAPATLTAPAPTSGAKFAKLIAEIAGVANVSDALEVHYFKPLPPTSITAVASGRKITVTINNAIGRTSTVSITGKVKVTLKPTVAKKVLTYTVTKGTKKVVITANGKTLTKTFIIK
jgi:hypothetical protein